MLNNYTHAAIVPLIGGLPLGTMQALNGKLPEYVLSYSAFAKNDAHFINHLKEKLAWNGDYVLLDTPEGENYRPSKQVDIVGATCPCAGLSSLSVTSSSDSAMNDWMYKTAEYVLEEIRPKVFWGENAPRLFTNHGKKVADRLYEIGRKNGYTLNLYFTKSVLHGLSQKRPRTFYFFTKGDKTPIFDYYRKPAQDIDEILQMEISPSDPMNILVNSNNPYDEPWLAYCMHKTESKTLKEYHDLIDKTTNCICACDSGNKSLLEVAEWFDSKGFNKSYSKRARAMQAKVDNNKGYWAHGTTMPKGIIPSLIGVMPYSIVNPYKNSYLTLRDCLRIMKMPENFDLVGDNPVKDTNMICQNVPVSTAADMATTIINYLDGKCDTVNGTLVHQNNESMKFTVDKQNDSASINDFFA